MSLCMWITLGTIALALVACLLNGWQAWRLRTLIAMYDARLRVIEEDCDV